MNPQLDAYIKQAKASGQTDEQIKQALLATGWKQEQINEAFGIPNPQGTAVPLPAMGAGSNKWMAALSYFSILVLIPLFTDAKNDPFVKFHVKQGLVLFGAGIVINFVLPMISILRPFGGLLSLVLGIFAILGLVNVYKGKQEYLPLIGKIGDSFKF